MYVSLKLEWNYKYKLTVAIEPMGIWANIFYFYAGDEEVKHLLSTFCV